MSLDKKFWYRQKGLATRNIHAQYESPISFGSKVNAKVKFFFQKQVNLGGQGHGIKSLVLTDRSCHKEYPCVT